MKNVRNTILICAISAFALQAADFSVTPDKDKKSITPGEKIVFTLVPDQNAQAAAIQISDFNGGKAFINGADTIAMKSVDNGKKFIAEITLKNLFSRYSNTENSMGGGALCFTPVITSGGKNIVLAPISSPWTLNSLPEMAIAGEIKSADGKFDEALHFCGKETMARIIKEFNPEKGTVEGWLYMPLISDKEENIIFHIQSLDASPWSYQTLKLLPDRSLQYLVYRSAGKLKAAAVTSKAQLKDDWIHFAAVYDIKEGKMKLYINNKLVGDKEYHEPAGGKIASYEFGGRIHNQGKGYKIINSTNMLLDEVRVSDVVRDVSKAVTEPFKADENTILLLHCDE